MKLSHIITLLVAALFFTGCASNETSSTSTATPTGGEAAPATAANDGAGEKTAYEGATGSGLLMERYKSGRIEGFRD
jgi:hypothetical protein